jgi:hypothetical protein
VRSGLANCGFTATLYDFSNRATLAREFVVWIIGSVNESGTMMATIGETLNPPFISGVPIHCAHCKQPFRSVNSRVEAWRSSTGKYFCNEFCAEDDEEATRFHRSLPADHTPLVQHCRGVGGR